MDELNTQVYTRALWATEIQVEMILVPNLDHIRSTVDQIGAGLFFFLTDTSLKLMSDYRHLSADIVGR